MTEELYIIFGTLMTNALYQAFFSIFQDITKIFIVMRGLLIILSKFPIKVKVESFILESDPELFAHGVTQNL